MNKFMFSIVRKIGEGSYLGEDSLIIERIRRERALNAHRRQTQGKKYKNKFITEDGKPYPA